MSDMVADAAEWFVPWRDGRMQVSVRTWLNERLLPLDVMERRDVLTLVEEAMRGNGGTLYGIEDLPKSVTERLR